MTAATSPLPCRLWHALRDAVAIGIDLMRAPAWTPQVAPLPTGTIDWLKMAGELKLPMPSVTLADVAVRPSVLEQLVEKLAPPGLVPCPACGVLVAPRGSTSTGAVAIHFATAASARPCAASWPAKAVR